jgi:hypothetical protein
MAVAWRRGFFRLYLIVSILISGGLAIGGLTSAPPDLFMGLATAAMVAAALWTVYGAAVWVVVGFGGTGPLALRPLVATLALLMVSALAVLVAAGVAKQQDAAREVAEANETRDKELRDAAESERDWKQMEEDDEAERKERVDQILASYPAEAEDLDRDRPYRYPLREFGSNDSSRKIPETAHDYLVECAHTFIRRKCAEELARVEYLRETPEAMVQRVWERQQRHRSSTSSSR